MKVISASGENFCSYKEISFDLDSTGLCLIAGPSGSGKSTIMDLVSWTLFGITSKEGASDDVKAWDADGPTQAQAVIELPDTTIWVFRTRGPKNDLFWLENGTGAEIRGKDLTDTQRLLDKRLGCNAELFLLGSYLTQFSKADSFFIAKAKDRREVLEKIADQEFAVSIGNKASDARKVTKKEKESLDLDYAAAVGRKDVLEDSIGDNERATKNWAGIQKASLELLQERLNNFDAEKAKTVEALQQKSDQWVEAKRKLETPVMDCNYADALEMLESDMVKIKVKRCGECGGPVKSEELDQVRDYYQQLKDARNKNALLLAKEAETNPHTAALEMAKNQANPYGEQIEAEKLKTNPFTQRHLDAITAFEAASFRCAGLEAQVEAKEALMASLTWLYDKSFELRSILMSRAVEQLQNSTNSYLEKHFDAALRVKFVLEDSDKLEVEITNDGFLCPFKSLSGGERTMLKLAFSLSLMRAAQDKAGISFNMLMLDEPFAGLSDDLKLKAFNLLRQLETEYASVLVIEHSTDMKAQFDRVFLVDKAGGHSQIHESEAK